MTTSTIEVPCDCGRCQACKRKARDAQRWREACASARAEIEGREGRWQGFTPLPKENDDATD